MMITMIRSPIQLKSLLDMDFNKLRKYRFKRMRRKVARRNALMEKVHIFLGCILSLCTIAALFIGFGLAMSLYDLLYCAGYHTVISIIACVLPVAAFILILNSFIYIFKNE